MASDAATAVTCNQGSTHMMSVRDGIPVMLLDDATPGPQGIGAHVVD